MTPADPLRKSRRLLPWPAGWFDALLISWLLGWRGEVGGAEREDFESGISDLQSQISDLRFQVSNLGPEVGCLTRGWGRRPAPQSVNGLLARWGRGRGGGRTPGGRRG